MDIKNFLNHKSGEFCVPIPLGIDLQIRYNTMGKVERVSLLNTRNSELTEDLELTHEFVQKRAIPIEINIKEGTTIVTGVFAKTDGQPYLFNGDISNPDDFKDTILKDIESDFDNYKFYSYSVWSGATSFHGSKTMKSWLGSNGFTTLNGFLLPAMITEQSIQQMEKYYCNDFPIVTKYAIFTDSGIDYINRDISQSITKTVSTQFDSNGYVHIKLVFQDKSEAIYPYTDKLKFGISRQENILLFEDGKILFNFDYIQPVNSDYTFTCPYCGKMYTITDLNEVITCSNEVCQSKQYSRVNRMLSALHLPMLSEKEYENKIGSEQLICIADALDVLGYEDCSIKVSLVDAIMSVIPVSVMPNSSVIEALCKNCNYSLQSLNYYFNNPHSISADLAIHQSRFLDNFCKWVSAAYNYSELCAIIGSEKLHITNIDDEKKFNGAPIFSNKKFVLTGEFVHGSHDEIARILRSYNATVVTDITGATCLLTGSTMNGIDGNLVREARRNKISVFDEVEFFNSYEIDKDLQENLL